MAGVPHHVTQRGNNRQAIFHREFDHEVYLDRFFGYAEKYSVRIWGYCLMPNHVHWVVVPEKPDSLARVMRCTAGDYARYINIRDGRCGHVWQARYYSCAMDEAHSWLALAYVERNPVRAGIVRFAEAYRWSTAQVHCGMARRSGKIDMHEWDERYSPAMWSEALRTSIDDAALTQRFRDATRNGRPLGGDGFIDQVSRALHRDLRIRRPGRPTKTRDSHLNSLFLCPQSPAPADSANGFSSALRP